MAFPTLEELLAMQKMRTTPEGWRAPMLAPGMEPLQQAAPQDPSADALMRDEKFMASMAPMDGKYDALAKQRAYAEVLMGSSNAQQRTTPMGAALSGIADVVNSYRGGKMMGGLGAQQAELDAQAAAGAKNRTLLTRTLDLDKRKAAEAQRLAEQTFGAEQSRLDREARATEGEANRKNARLLQRMENDRPRGGSAPTYSTFIAADGRAYQVNPSNPNEPAHPVVGPDGQQLAKPDAGAEKRKQQTVEIEERYKAMDKALAEMEQRIDDKGTWQMMGPHNATLEGLITSYATDAAKLRDADSAAREAEVALEKKALFEPGLGTKNSTAIELIRGARERMKDRRDEAYRVRGLSAPDGDTPKPSTDDQAALEWARANGNDPRAKRILERLGK